MNPEALLAKFGNEAQSLIQFWSEDADERIWDALGGYRGLARIYSNTSLIVDAIALLVRQYPELAQGEYERVCCEAIYLKLSVIGCIFENLSIRFFPKIPRIQARSCAQLYSELWMTLDNILGARSYYAQALNGVKVISAR